MTKQLPIDAPDIPFRVWRLATERLDLLEEFVGEAIRSGRLRPRIRCT